MRPSISALRLWVSCQIKSFNVSIPKHFAVKNFTRGAKPPRSCATAERLKHYHRFTPVTGFVPIGE
jgi:hypothetical protein